MKNIRFFFYFIIIIIIFFFFLVVKFSKYLNMRIFAMLTEQTSNMHIKDLTVTALKLFL